MSAEILEIHNKNKNPNAGLELRHFDFTEGDEVSLEMLDHPNVSLCCLYPANRRVIFVETPEGIDLYKFPFIRNAQFEYAQRLIAISHDDLH